MPSYRRFLYIKVAEREPNIGGEKKEREQREREKERERRETRRGSNGRRGRWRSSEEGGKVAKRRYREGSPKCEYVRKRETERRGSQLD